MVNSGTVVSESPAVRVCVEGSSETTCRQLAVAYSIYHRLRGDHGDELILAKETSDYTLTQTLTTEICKTYCNEFGLLRSTNLRKEVEVGGACNSVHFNELSNSSSDLEVIVDAGE